MLVVLKLLTQNTIEVIKTKANVNTKTFSVNQLHD
jgi:hypothetical protein